MARPPKFNFDDFSILDELYNETSTIPTYSAITQEISDFVGDGYIPSASTISKYRKKWLEQKKLDPCSLRSTVAEKVSASETLSAQLQNIVSEISNMGQFVSSVVDSPSEVQFLESKIQALELENSQLRLENAELKGRVSGFDQAHQNIKLLLHQHNLDIISLLKTEVKERKSELEKAESQLASEVESDEEWFSEFKAQCSSILQKSGRSELENHLNTFTIAKLHDFSVLMSPTNKPSKRSTKLKFVEFLISQFELT